MSHDWYLINPPNQISGYESEYLYDYGVDSFSDLLDSFVGEDLIIYNSDLSDFKTVKVIVSNKVGNSSLSKYELALLLPLNTCNTGMYVKYKNNYWLITSYTNDNMIYQKAIMHLCNYTLKFQHPETGEILSYPCITSNRIQGYGDKETNMMTLLDGRKTVLLPYDKSTVLLRNDKRLYLDNHPVKPRPYKITFVDTTSHVYGEHGLVEFYATETQSQSNDRPDLGICNYFEPGGSPTPIEDGYVTIDVDSLILGLTTTITPTFYNSDGFVQNEVVAMWDVNKPDGVTVDYIDNKCIITIPDDFNLLGESVVINISDENDNYSSTFELIIGTF